MVGDATTSWAAARYNRVPICSTSSRADEGSIDASTATESTASTIDQEGLEIQISLQDFLSNAELTAAETSSFSDDDISEDDGNLNFWMEDEDENNDYDSNDLSTTQRQIPSYLRDEEEMLTEREDRLYATTSNRQRTVEACILVGVDDISEERQQHRTGGTTTTIFTMEESMKEMRELIKTAGMELKGEITQRLQEPNPRTYVGTGKLAETQEMAKLRHACTIVFDAELTPGQQKSLENAFNKNILQNDFLGSEGREIKVIDRTALILDIFAQHAKTREGKLQVDLALHEYRKPRLTRMWTHLERQSAGGSGGSGFVGLRGPGESQLEIDKRLIRDRIITLKKKIDSVQKQRDLHRRGRDNSGLPVLALVGYTNSGKTTLLNYLTRAGAMAENMLFATLDPTTRKVKLPGFKTHPEVLLTDTVGFIQKLPTQLIAAFRATLEEVREADVLVHVIDVSNPSWKKQEVAVLKVLEEIGVASDKPIVRVLNKIDLLSDHGEEIKYEAALVPSSVAVSSLTGDAMEDFVAYVEEALSDQLVPIEAEIPFTNGEELNVIHEVGNVEVIDYRSTGTYIVARVPKAIANRLKKYLVAKGNSIADTELSEISTKTEDIDWVAIGRGRHSAKGM